MVLSFDSAHLSQLEEEYSRNPLYASLRVQKLEESETVALDSNDKHDKCEGNERYIDIDICLPQELLHLSDDSPQKTHVILVADRSVSMAGNPWNQVRQAIIDVVGDSFNNESIHADVVTYDSDATHVSYTQYNYQQVLDNIAVEGGTDFGKAFLKVDDVIGSTSGETLSKVVIIFLTDGNDRGNTEENLEQWEIRLSKLDQDVTVHTVGFSENHDFACLQSLSRVGSTPGMYRYCEPGEGPEALRAKLKDLYQFVSISCTTTVELEVEMTERNQLIHLGVHTPKATIKGEIIHSAPFRFCTEAWICLQDEKSLYATKMFLLITLIKGKQSHQLRIPVIIKEIFRQKNVAGQVVWVMVFAKDTDILTVEFAGTVEMKKDIGDIQKRICHLQKQADIKPEFGENVTSEMKDFMTEVMQNSKERIEKVNSLASRYSGGERESVSMLAGVKDLRCEVQIQQTSKARRFHEIIEKVIPKGMVMDQTDRRKLKELSVKDDETDMLSEEVERFYCCALSKNSIKDILCSKAEAENVIGFGLVIDGRGDAPAAIRIQYISDTLISRTCIYYRFDNGPPVRGYPSDKGGFNVKDNRQRDLNAWLPLYITKSHWKRVKLLLKPSLGYLCASDPMKYDEKQLDVFFTVLGSMIGQLCEKNTGDHQLKLVFAVQRMCCAIVLHFGMREKISAVVKNFIDSPEGRKEEVIPNIYTLIGFLVSMPRFVIKSLLGYDAKYSSRLTPETDGTAERLPKKARAFWFAVLIECMHRASPFAFRRISVSTLNRVADGLVMSDANTDSSETTCRGRSIATLIEGCKTLQTMRVKEIKLVPSKSLPAQTSQPVIEMDKSEDMDRAMDLWAQDKCGSVIYQRQDDEVAKAKEDVNNLLHKIKQNLPGVEPDLDQIDSSVLDVTTKLMELLRRAFFPSLNVFPGFITFVDHWLKFEKDFMEMDMNGGLPPEHWIREAKETVSEVGDKMKEFLKDHKSETTKEVDEDTSGISGLQHETSEGEDTQCHPLPTDVLFPVVLNIIDPNVNQIRFLRAVLGQIIICHTKQASDSNTSKDLCHMENVPEVLRAVHTKLQASATTKMADKNFYQIANHRMLQTERIWAFNGYLMNAYKDRGEGFGVLIKSIMKRNRANPIPLLADKLRVLLSGRFEGHVVFANGNVWIPGEQRVKRFKELIGAETWSQIENELKSSIRPHVYRESDKPNRHGRTYITQQE